MAFIAMNGLLGEVDLTTIDPAGPGPINLVTGVGSGRQNFMGQVVTGYDPVLGAGEFVYAKVGSASGGTVSNMVQLGGVVTPAAVLQVSGYAGTANSGVPLAVVIAAGAAIGQFAWFQIGGLAIVACTGSPAAGNPVYWAANNTVSATAVAGKQVLNAVFASPAGATIGSGSTAITLSSTQALVLLNRPFNQGAIT